MSTGIAHRCGRPETEEKVIRTGAVEQQMKSITMDCSVLNIKEAAFWRIEPHPPGAGQAPSFRD